MLGEEWVPDWDLDGEAVGVRGSLAALWGLSRLGVPRLEGQRDVVVDELAPSDQDDGHRVVVEALGGGTMRDEKASFSTHVKT